MEFFSNLKVKPPLHKCKAPLIDDFLVTVLFRSQCKSLVVKGAKSVSMAISLTNRRDVTRTWKATCRFLWLVPNLRRSLSSNRSCRFLCGGKRWRRHRRMTGLLSFLRRQCGLGWAWVWMSTCGLHTLSFDRGHTHKIHDKRAAMH